MSEWASEECYWQLSFVYLFLFCLKVHNNHDDHHVHMNGNGILSKLPLKENNKAMDETAQLLESYQRKEEEIVEIEKTEPLAMFYIKKSHLESITTKIEQMENQSLQWRNE